MRVRERGLPTYRLSTLGPLFLKAHSGQDNYHVFYVYPHTEATCFSKNGTSRDRQLSGSSQHI